MPGPEIRAGRKSSANGNPFVAGCPAPSRALAGARLRRGLLCRHDQVVFNFAMFVVDHDRHRPGCNRA